MISTVTGELTETQRMWMGVLHAGNSALVGGLSAAKLHGLRNWDRDDVTILVPDDWSFEDIPGVTFFRTRRSAGRPVHHSLDDGSRSACVPGGAGNPALRGLRKESLEPHQGAVAAVVQQGLTRSRSARADGSGGYGPCAGRRCSGGSSSTSRAALSPWRRSTCVACVERCRSSSS